MLADANEIFENGTSRQAAPEERKRYLGEPTMEPAREPLSEEQKKFTETTMKVSAALHGMNYLEIMHLMAIVTVHMLREANPKTYADYFVDFREACDALITDYYRMKNSL